MGALCLHSRSRICLEGRDILSVDFEILPIFSRLSFVKKKQNPIFALAFGTRVSLFSRNVWKQVL
jgi:hypothetical protein